MRFASLIIGAFAATAATAAVSVASPEPSTAASSFGMKPEDLQSVHDFPVDADSQITSLLTSMETDDRGFAHLADDGVLRSYAADGTVLEATPFSNAQIRALIDTRPPVWEPYRDELLRMFADIDGHQGEGMKHDVLLDPPVNLKPAVFGGPDHALPELDAKLAELIKAKRVDATSVEDKVTELRKHSEISAHRSANPLFLVKANINKKPQLWCLGQICSSHEGCRIMGCNACIFVDALISKVKTCR